VLECGRGEFRKTRFEMIERPAGDEQCFEDFGT
jgi:hypothetical protein